MEMTIARDRWQDHLKTRGRHYHDRATELEELHTEYPAVGAGIAALAAHALAELLEWARVDRLTRNQHVLLRFGELIAKAEGAGALARRAARAEAGTLNAKADRRFDAAALSAVSRVWARTAALDVAEQGLRWTVGADSSGRDVSAGASAIGLAAIHAAQAGLLADMNLVADALYGRQS
jgi:alkylation response protein AidB-like acyl-CoA dehydrogenase